MRISSGKANISNTVVEENVLLYSREYYLSNNQENILSLTIMCRSKYLMGKYYPNEIRKAITMKKILLYSREYSLSIKQEIILYLTIKIRSKYLTNEIRKPITMKNILLDINNCQMIR